MSAPGWSVVEVDARMMEDMRNLFLRVFGHPISPGLWRWKYGAGRGGAVGARSPEGNLLAHYGGTRRELVVFGHRVLAVQIGDVMVAQEGRAALSHKGPFGIVVQAFMSKHIGAINSALLGFGFPNARHMRLGERLGHYAQVDRIVELSWTVKPSVQYQQLPTVYQQAASVHALDWADPTTPVRIGKLWDAMRHELNGWVVASRDVDWWRHRFANHPEHRHAYFWVNKDEGSEISGAMVLRIHDTKVPEGVVWELMDWIAAPAHAQTIVRAAMDALASAGGGRLTNWCSSGVRQLLASTSPHVQEVCAVGITIPKNGITYPIGDVLSPSIEDLRGKWWLTSGDTDFR